MRAQLFVIVCEPVDNIGKSHWEDCIAFGVRTRWGTFPGDLLFGTQNRKMVVLDASFSCQGTPKVIGPHVASTCGIHL